MGTLYQTTRDIYFSSVDHGGEYNVPPNDATNTKARWNLASAYKKKACSMIYAQLPTNSSSLKRALKKKRKTRIQGKAAGLTTNQVSFLWPAFSLRTNERTKRKIYSRMIDTLLRVSWINLIETDVLIISYEFLVSLISKKKFFSHGCTTKVVHKERENCEKRGEGMGVSSLDVVSKFF